MASARCEAPEVPVSSRIMANSSPPKRAARSPGRRSTPARARACVRRGLALVGIDALSIEPLADPAFPVHHILLGAAIRILEGLFLADIAPGRYRLACPPPHVPEAEAAPVRAALGPLP